MGRGSVATALPWLILTAYVLTERQAGYTATPVTVCAVQTSQITSCMLMHGRCNRQQHCHLGLCAGAMKQSLK
jgi:hypothetical protein